MSGHPTPEEAVLAEDSVPPQFINVVATDYAPSGNRAVVLVEYNEPPAVEPYVVLCERTSSGWVGGHGSAGDGLSWMSTGSGDLGVEVDWRGRAPSVRWDVPGGPEPEPPPDADPW